MAKRRRSTGEGSKIFKRKDGRYVAFLSLGSRGEKRNRPAFYGKTEKEVREKLTKAARERDLGMFAAGGANPTVQRFLEDWLATKKSKVRIRSYERYAGLVHNHIVPVIGQVRIEKLTPSHVQTLLDSKLSALAPRTVQAIRIVLSEALLQAVHWQMLPRNVADLVKGPKAEERELSVLAPQQAKAFLVACRGARLEALYVLALHTGMRRGELLGLKWDDVNLDAGTLQVRRTLGRSCTAGIVVNAPKSSKGRRVISLSEPVIAALRAHRKRQLERRLLEGPDWRDTGYVFSTFIGTSLDPRLVGEDFRAMLIKAELPQIRFHDLRHSAATIALSAGVHPKIVSEMLGHSRISLTLDVYTHSLPTLQTEAAEKMAAALLNAS